MYTDTVTHATTIITSQVSYFVKPTYILCKNAYLVQETFNTSTCPERLDGCVEIFRVGCHEWNMSDKPQKQAAE